MTKYNINELLEMKKSLESKIEELTKINQVVLVYVTVNTIDYTNDKNNRQIEIRPRTTAAEFVTEFSGVADELAKIKTAIQKYNGGVLVGKICERESLRRKIDYLGKIKVLLSREKGCKRDIVRKDANQVTLEVQETMAEPMFSHKEIETMIDQFAKQERKINTEIQRLNLDQIIEL